MDARWAPVVSAVAVAVLVGGVVAAVGSGADDPRLSAPRVAASPSEQPSVQPSQTPSPLTSEPPPEPEPSSEPADPSSPVASSPDPQPAPTRTASAAPPPPSPSPAPPTGERSSLAFDSAYGTDEPREVVVQYGESGSCPYQNVTHTVRESATEVVVTLEADSMEPGRPCTADYRPVLVPVRLAAPMGDRVLVDGSRGEAVPVDRSCTRPYGNPPPPKDCQP